jgi:hypothetical protein
VLGKVSEVPESVDAASRLVFPPLEERVLLKELVDAHPGVRVFDLVGPLWRVRDRHELSISLGGMWHSHPMGLGFGSVVLEFHLRGLFDRSNVVVDDIAGGPRRRDSLLELFYGGGRTAHRLMRRCGL